MSNLALIGIGASVPPALDRAQNAIQELGAHKFLRLQGVSDVVQTPAWGGATTQRFANAAVVVETPLSPPALLRALWALEARFGRVRLKKNGPRTLDLDVLAIAGISSTDPRLMLPHPGLFTRAFARLPAQQALARSPVASRIALAKFVNGQIRQATAEFDRV